MQNRKLTLTAIKKTMACLILFCVVFSGCSNTAVKGNKTGASPINSGLKAMNPRASQPDLSGIKEVSPKALKPLLQTVNPASTPTVLFFNSKFCYDCKKMKPVIQQLADENQASLVVYPIDLLAPQKSDAPIISAIRPVTVPTLVFISETTKITTVLYNYQPEMALRDALSTIL